MPLLHDVLRHARQPDRLAVIDGEARLSYRDLWHRVQRATGWLGRNLPPGARVGLLLGNTADAVVTTYGVCAAGLVAVPLDADIHPRNLAAILEDCGASLLIASPRLRVRAPAGAVGPPLVTPDAIDGPAAADGRPAASARDLACVLYTTGTTGPRKGVMLSHENLLAATANINAFMTPGPWLVESVPMRLSHSFGFGRLRAVLDAGGTVVLEDGLSRIDRVLGNADAHGVNAIALVPAGVGLLLDHYLEPFTAVAGRLRLIEVGSAALPARHRDRLVEACPNARICLHYGLTEASRAAFLDVRADRGFLDTAGRAAPNVRLRIAGGDGAPRPAGAPGEILVRGAMVTAGYWNRPDLTAAAVADGWLRTGDVGSLDEHGYLHVAGRVEDVLNLGGMKVAAAGIEDRLRAAGPVVDAAVALSADAEGIGPGVTAYVVIDDAARFDDWPALRRHCLEELEPYKVPREFRVVDALPRTSSGKLQRHLLGRLSPRTTWNSSQTMCARS